MCISDCKARCAPVANWVMLSWVGVSCTAATCWLKWADIKCSHRISTVFELLAASRFRLEPHCNRRSEWTFPEKYYTYTLLCWNYIFFYHIFGPDSTCSCVTFPCISVGVCSFHWALLSPLLLPDSTTIFQIAMRPWLVPPAKISEGGHNVI